MKIAVCDDEKVVREELYDLLRRVSGGDAIDLYASAEPLFSDMEKTRRYDVIFLDIQMPGLSGMDAARELRAEGIDAALVFVTALKEYAVEAFDVDAAHYLVKPVEPEKFFAVYEKVRELVQKRQDADEILIKTGQEHIRLKKDEVLYAESELRKVVLHTKSGRFELYGTMEKAAAMLGDGFFRCHRSYLVNLGSIVRYGNEELFLSNGESINLSRHRYADFVRVYMRYLKAGGVGLVE